MDKTIRGKCAYGCFHTSLSNDFKLQKLKTKFKITELVE